LPEKFSQKEILQEGKPILGHRHKEEEKKETIDPYKLRNK